MASRIFKTFELGLLELPSWPPRSLQQSQAAPQAPSWRGRWPHEATKAHLETYFDLFPRDFGTAIGKKYKKHSYCPFEAIIGYRVPIHSLPKLQEQRGGLRVSALGSAALSAPSEWRVTAFQIEADTLASSSSFLALKTSKDVFSGGDSGTTSRTSIFLQISSIL